MINHCFSAFLIVRFNYSTARSLAVFLFFCLQHLSHFLSSPSRAICVSSWTLGLIRPSLPLKSHPLREAFRSVVLRGHVVIRNQQPAEWQLSLQRERGQLSVHLLRYRCRLNICATPLRTARARLKQKVLLSQFNICIFPQVLAVDILCRGEKNPGWVLETSEAASLRWED